MANLTITLKTQSVRALGPTPAQQWGASAAMVWGSSPWGCKVLGQGNSPQLPEDISKQWTGSNSTPVTMPASAVFLNSTKTWGGISKIVLIYKNTDKEEYDGRGYHYVFVDRVINAESAAVNVWTSASVINLPG